MKNLFFTFLALCVFTVASSCNKDDDMDDSDNLINAFTYDGTTYSLSNGFYTAYGDNGNGTYDWDVFLTTEGVTGNLTGLTGIGESVYLDLNTDVETEVAVGTYNWSSTRESFTIVSGSAIFLNYDFTNLTGTSIELTGGTVDVSIDGAETIITFTLNTTDGKTVRGGWKGVPSIF